MTEFRLDRRAVLSGIAGCAAAAAAPPPGPLVLPAMAGRRADVALFARTYGLLHPGLWRYQTVPGWTAQIEKLQAEAAAARHPGDYWLAFARATAAVRCGHSYVSPFNMGKRWSAVLEARRDRLPFAFRWVDGRMIVTDPHVDHPALRAGTWVSEIDGEQDSALMRRLLPLARADGANDFKRVANMEVRTDASKWENFDILRALHRDPAPVTARLRLEPVGGRTIALDLPTLGAESRKRGPDDDRMGWTVRTEGDATVLTMPDWTSYRSKWDWRGWLTEVIDGAIDRGSRRFIMDLRGNEGGEDCGDPILQRIITAPLEEAGAAQRVRFRETPPDLRFMLNTWDESFHGLGLTAEGPDSQGFYTLPGGGPEALSPAPGKRLGARLIVLMDSSNSSATFQFARRVQRSRLGILLGEPSGGNQRGINGGAFFFLRLPESGLEVDLPLIGFFPGGQPPDAGLMPDIPVQTTRESLASGSDPQLARALALPMA